MNITKLGKIKGGQDGAVWNGYMFRLNHKGVCSVYRIEELSEKCECICCFTLDKAEQILPHSNSVCFGAQRYDGADEFPLLYSNIYNNYAKAEDPMKGVTCVYRLQREGENFFTTLVQIIEIGFTEDPLWRSATVRDKRPYGNSVIDPENHLYYAFTMRDEEQSTRYFAFTLPDVRAGVTDERLGVKRVMLGKADIRSFFDCEYHHFVQGACFHKGRIYSLEGFDEKIPPALRVIDPAEQSQRAVYFFLERGVVGEPEWIDFDGGECYYADCEGNVYQLKF